MNETASRPDDRPWQKRFAAALSPALLVAALACVSNPAAARSLEPRSYSNSPVGLNFLVAGYAYTEGTLAFDPSTTITDAQYTADTGVFAYLRTFDAWGKSAKFDVVVPYSYFAADGLVSGQPRQREMSGLMDPLFRFAVNFYGAPALSLKEFGSYEQDLIIGATMQVSAPLGDYDNTKLLNLGNNRWALKTEVGVSQAWGRWTVELAPSVTVYTDNKDFNQGKTFEQEPLYAVQAHLIYNLPSGIWMAVDSTYFSGEQTSLNGVKSNNRQTNSRAGLTLALPIDRQHSVKFSASDGTSSRTGSDFTTFAVAWQYRWFSGP